MNKGFHSEQTLRNLLLNPHDEDFVFLGLAG